MPTDVSSIRLPDLVVQACRAHDLLGAGARVLVAVSAGADSTALACLLSEVRHRGLPLDLVLGHVDHGWRGAQAAAGDARHVRDLAARLSLPADFSPPPPPGTPRTEDAARRWRYRGLGALARQHGCTFVATGHHAGDQAETFLMRLLRGSGPVGLAGIPYQRTLQPGDLTVVRPLLDLEPQRLRSWLGTRGIPWRDDPTNRDLTRDRAAIRARLAERAAAVPGSASTLAALARRLRRRLQAHEAHIAKTADVLLGHHPEAAAVEVPRTWPASLRSEDLGLALRRMGTLLHAEADGPWFTRRHVERIEGLLLHGGDLDLPRGLVFHVAGSTAWLARRELPPVALPRVHRSDLDRAEFDLAGFLGAGEVRTAALDADRLGPEARLRLWRPGDRFTPFGRGSRRPVDVGRWLSKHGVPALCRRGQLVLEGRHGIAWLVGRRVDAGHAVGNSTARVAVVGLTSKS